MSGSPNFFTIPYRKEFRLIGKGIRRGSGAKRVIDILVSSIGLVLLSPFFLYIAARIRRDSPGPIFYRGQRVGRGGKAFKILKFRTMYERPESYKGPRVTAQDDPRITPLGKWLRETKANEIPQLWNVLKGEMSLVGPRPEDPEIVVRWPDIVRQEVLSMRPGLTSPASVLYRDEERLLSTGEAMDLYLSEILPSKLRLDQLYVRHHSFWGDLDVVFWTLLVLLPKASTYSPGEKRLFAGPISLFMRYHMSWLLVDTLVTFVAMGLVGLLWRQLGPLNVGWLPAIVLAVGFAALFSLVNAAQGVNRIDWEHAAASDVFDLLPGAVLATFIALLLNYIFPGDLLGIRTTEPLTPWGTRILLPPGLISMAAVLSTLGFVIVRYRSRLVTGLATRWVAWRGPSASTRERVLIIGGGEAGQFAAWMLSHGRYSDSFQMIGFVDDDLYKQDKRIAGINVLGQRTDIVRLVKDYDIGIIVFAIHNISATEKQLVLKICTSTPARVFLFPNIQAALSLISRNGDVKPHPANAGEISRQQNVQEGTTTGRAQDHQPVNQDPLAGMEEWLEELEGRAQSGDVAGVLSRIQEIRGQMHKTSADLATNQKGNQE